MSAMITPEQLLAAATTLVERAPDAALRKNAIGNLVVETNGEYSGYVDLATGEVVLFEEAQT